MRKPKFRVWNPGPGKPGPVSRVLDIAIYCYYFEKKCNGTKLFLESYSYICTLLSGTREMYAIRLA